MRSSSVVTISMHPALLRESNKMADKLRMTKSELIRTAVRRFLEEQDAAEALRVYRREAKGGSLKVLKGSLADLMN